MYVRYVCMSVRCYREIDVIGGQVREWFISEGLSGEKCWNHCGFNGSKKKEKKVFRKPCGRKWKCQMHKNRGFSPVSRERTSIFSANFFIGPGFFQGRRPGVAEFLHTLVFPPERQLFKYQKQSFRKRTGREGGGLLEFDLQIFRWSRRLQSD